MSTLGQTGSGFTFSVSAGAGWGDFAGGSYTVPSPGIIVSAIHAYVGNGGTTQNCRLYVWQASGSIPGTWLIRGTLNNLLGLGLQTQNSLTNNAGSVATSDLYIPAGTVIWIGAYLSAGSGQLSAASGSGGGTELGNTSDGNWSDHGPAGVGQMCAYIDYTPLAAPTISSISPSVSPPGSNVTITGTGFLHATGVTIGGVAASFSITDDSHITATVPSSVGGVVTVTVTNPAGSASSSMTAGQIYVGISGSVNSIVAIWAGTTPAKIPGVWVPTPPAAPTGVKRVW